MPSRDVPMYPPSIVQVSPASCVIAIAPSMATAKHVLTAGQLIPWNSRLMEAVCEAHVAPPSCVTTNTPSIPYGSTPPTATHIVTVGQLMLASDQLPDVDCVQDAPPSVVARIVAPPSAKQACTLGQLTPARSVVTPELSSVHVAPSLCVDRIVPSLPTATQLLVPATQLMAARPFVVPELCAAQGSSWLAASVDCTARRAVPRSSELPERVIPLAPPPSRWARTTRATPAWEVTVVRSPGRTAANATRLPLRETAVSGSTRKAARCVPRRTTTDEAERRTSVPTACSMRCCCAGLAAERWDKPVLGTRSSRDNFPAGRVVSSGGTGPGSTSRATCALCAATGATRLGAAGALCREVGRFQARGVGTLVPCTAAGAP